jgi:hypothetical protein
MKLEAGRYYKALVSINALKDSMEDVTEQLKPHTFPTLEEFRQWRDEYAEGIESIYDYFRTRIQPLEIGREYEFSKNGERWTLDNLDGYLGKYANWKHIRPIQPEPPPKREVVLEDLKKFREGNNDAVLLSSNTIDAVIKLLEGEK